MLVGLLSTKMLLVAISFSRNFGTVGSIPVVGLAGVGLIAFIFLIAAANYLTLTQSNLFLKSIIYHKYVRWFVFVVSVGAVIASTTHEQYWKLAPIVIFLGILYAALSRGVTRRSHPEFFVFMNIGAVLGLCYAFASGDGFYQLPYGVSLAIPFLLFAATIKGEPSAGIRANDNIVYTEDLGSARIFSALAFVAMTYIVWETHTERISFTN